VINFLVSPDRWQGSHIFDFFLFTGNEAKPAEKMWALLGHMPCELGLRVKNERESAPQW